jgi:hypothetical protein
MPGVNSRRHKEVGLVVVFGSEGLGLRAPRLSRLRAVRGCRDMENEIEPPNRSGS